MLVKGLLERRKRVSASKRFHRFNARSLHLRCQSDAAAPGLAVDKDSAGTAHAMRAADMGSGKLQLIAEKIHQKQTVRHASLNMPAVDRHADQNFLFAHRFGPSATACSRARRTRRGSS